MKYLFVLTFLISLSGWTQNYNLDSLSHIDYNVLHSSELNDIWGYTDELGNEYALVGAEKGVSVVDITDPQNPVEVYWHVGMSSIWRDIKTFGDYAYVTTEADDGLLIIDLSPLPGNPIINTANYYNTSDYWSSAHNLYIDENGYGYIFGSNRGNGGAIILDLFTNPMQPIEVGIYDNWYIHDGYVVNDMLYAAHINDGFFTIVDVSDKANPIILGSQVTPSSFAHNIWPTDDQNFVFTTDELTRSFIGAYDVSDPSNIIEVDRTQSSPGSGVVPHNVHVKGDFLFTSYYADGIIVHDISDPSNMIEVARYDTYPGSANYTIGNWGAFPYFASGTILATDIENGLFILGSDFNYASRIEGTITNQNNGNPIQGVDVTILGDVQTEISKVNGTYKTGIGVPGNYSIRYEKYGFVPQEIQLTLSANTVYNQDIQLEPLQQYGIEIKVVDEFDTPILGADVKIVHEGVVFELQTNGLGIVNQDVSYTDTFFVAAGKWEKITTCENFEFSPNINQLTLVLEKGYMDDFTFDFGWSETSSAETGDWERGVPFFNADPTLRSSPDNDSPNDCGESCFITGNQEGVSVMRGEVTLISPVFDLSSFNEPFLNYERWFFNFHGFQPFNDTLRIAISNGTEIIEIDKQGYEFSILGVWVPVFKKISDYLTPSSTMQIFVQTSNYELSNNITNAAFDNFYITDGSPLGNELESIEKQLVSIYPNPFSDQITIEGIKENSTLRLFSIDGKKLNFEVDYTENSAEINSTNLSSGVYLLHVDGAVYTVVK
ncbi:choice-of-anchor B family protein [Brumimicrobium glaciale]|uniref:Choice-of-anchor B family protein n=1 Tax=Brumimicrobium glaciale TaxID=200475 RepID=A0A4Q4KMS6_9FLAO|nr:choice-of-anchor B family protein [Brumimicrobium glaciale]RYM34723.1 choice-of-anchor B family protein [Brumimicrobium glaciale]